MKISLSDSVVDIALSLGSNTDAPQNIAKAKTLLQQLLPDVVFSPEQWTQPYPTPAVPHPTEPYLNCLATATTTRSLDDLTARLKQLEHELGDSHENHQRGRVLIDIDVHRYGDKIVKEILW